MTLSVGIALIEFRAAQLRPADTAVAAAVDPVTGATLNPEPLYGGSARDYVAGILVCTMALTVIAYGLCIYLWRLRKLRRRDTTGYYDPFGPPVLVLAVMAAVILYISVFVNGCAIAVPGSPLHPDPTRARTHVDDARAGGSSDLCQHAVVHPCAFPHLSCQVTETVAVHACRFIVVVADLLTSRTRSRRSHSPAPTSCNTLRWCRSIESKRRFKGHRRWSCRVA